MSPFLPASTKIPNGDYPYYRRTWYRVVFALLAVAFIPLVLIGGGTYYLSASVLKAKTLETLTFEVAQHKRVIDEFLSERTQDLKLLAANLGAETLSSRASLQKAFQSLQKEKPFFQDLGLIDDQGRHLAYVGPYDLMERNYRDAPWFRETISRGVFISDVFSGFRQVPHFVIAVRLPAGDRRWIIRATVNAVFFERLVGEITGKRGGDAYLVNADGAFQSRPPAGPKGTVASGLPTADRFAGVRVHEKGDTLYLSAWLERVPWLSVVQMPRSEIFQALHRARNLSLAIFLLGAILIVAATLLTTNYLVGRLELKRRSIRLLDQQLRCTSYMASSMELAYAFFRDLKTSLTNLDVSAAWLRDALPAENPGDLNDTVGQIKSEVGRCREAIDKFLHFVRPAEPIIAETDVNALLEDLLGILASELQYQNITVLRDYQDHLPTIRSERGKLRQLFQNVVLNAVAAVERDGEISVTTRTAGIGVQVTIGDSGPGVPPDIADKIFEPLFTTKASGTGLGLAICRSILDKIGGTIRVESTPARGAAFIIELPFRLTSQAE